LLLFYVVNFFLTVFLLKRHFSRKYSFESKIQSLREELNVLGIENAKGVKVNSALEAKIVRYNSLKTIIEEINQNLDLDSTADSLASIAFSLIANSKGVCGLYLVDNQTQKLNLFKTHKENPGLTIRAKEGSILDFWVLMHAQPLLIEDIKKDFRFDIEKLKLRDSRAVASLISAPFISEDKLLGLLRLDNEAPGYYTQDDLRFLATICDLGAVALENSQLFQKTQDLAIHDGLTSLFTKGYFLGRLREECKRDMRQDVAFSLLMLDIDFFKDYNDKFGHTAGDIVLKKLSQIIIGSLKDLSPIVSRFGGEEFCIMLTGTDKKKAHLVADKLRKVIEKEKIILRRQETHITVSIGVAAFPSDGVSEDELLQAADRAMYAAKQKGRNLVC
jgi:diguanylate cyclase (GGDEF)-like protein